MSLNVSEVKVKTSLGKPKLLGDFKGQVLLVVNVASKCGFTKQYKGLQAIQDKYQDQGFQVLAFPCNDFGGQEPGTLEEIQKFCDSNYQTTFTIFDKVHAKGTTTEPYLTLNKFPPSGDVDWNFEKFLINKNSEVIARFKSSIEPENQEITNLIEQALLQS
tara:strand:+ start:237 stop:719 length:483 start_codon:yes stop_codon:yes gene_type:complete